LTGVTFHHPSCNVTSFDQCCVSLSGSTSIDKGQPFAKEAFGNVFRDAAREAGVSKSAHGLRKIAATRCAENGATVPQMNAIFGWTGERMALHYIEAANRKKMAADAMHKLMNENRTSIVAPEGKVRHSGQSDQ